MESEIKRLEEISDFYGKGDYIDERIADKEMEYIFNFWGVQGTHKWKTVLEVGCGNGYSTQKLSEKFDNLTVVEPSSKNIELMKQRLNNKSLKIHQTLLEDFETNDKYDAIIFLNVLEHVEEPINILRKLEQLLTDEGVLFVSVPNCLCLNKRAGYQMGLLETYGKLAPKDIALGHRRLYTVNMLKDHIEQADMYVKTIKGIFIKPLSEKQMFELGENAIRAFMDLGEDIPDYCANILAIASKKYFL